MLHNNPKVVDIVVQIYLVVSAHEFGFGIFTAVCMKEDYQIAKGLLVC